MMRRHSLHAGTVTSSQPSIYKFLDPNAAKSCPTFVHDLDSHISSGKEVVGFMHCA